MMMMMLVELELLLLLLLFFPSRAFFRFEIRKMDTQVVLVIVKRLSIRHFQEAFCDMSPNAIEPLFG